MPALINSSLNLPMSASSCGLGITPASESLLALTRTMTFMETPGGFLYGPISVPSLLCRGFPKWPNFDRTALQQNRAALGKFAGCCERVGLHDRVAPYDLFGFGERPVRDDLLGTHHEPLFRLQAVAGI